MYAKELQELQIGSRMEESAEKWHVRWNVSDLVSRFALPASVLWANMSKMQKAISKW